MARRKQPPAPPAPPDFSSRPFAALKRITIAGPVSPVKSAPPEKVSPPEAADNSADLFLEAMSGVQRLDGTKSAPRRSSCAAAPVPSGPSRPKEPSEPPPDPLFLREIGRLNLDTTFRDSLPDDGELTPLSGNRLKMIKRGTISVTRQLDLHGLTRQEALLELPRFLASARRKGEKAVLIITGKGNNSPDGPVLQQAVASWLRDAGREDVLEFAPAPREMGGSGALVVFLRVTGASQPARTDDNEDADL